MQRERGAVLTGLGLGIALMYFLDPDRGRRRRALVRDKVARAANVSADTLGARGRDLAHRTAGTVSQVRGAWRRDQVDDVVLVERVRAELGRLVSHPRTIDVEASNGRVTLHGPVLQTELNHLLRAVERVRGVREVVNELEPHAQPGNVPSLQGRAT
jgi:hypothetical protein